MGITVKIGVLCDDRHRNKHGTCEVSATLDAELSTDGLVKIPYALNGWVFSKSHYGVQGARCSACNELEQKGWPKP